MKTFREQIDVNPTVLFIIISIGSFSGVIFSLYSMGIPVQRTALPAFISSMMVPIMYLSSSLMSKMVGDTRDMYFQNIPSPAIALWIAVCCIPIFHVCTLACWYLSVVYVEAIGNVDLQWFEWMWFELYDVFSITAHEPVADPELSALVIIFLDVPACIMASIIALKNL